MNMGINKLSRKVEDFFVLSSKKQRKKHEKLLEIVENLEKKRSELKKKLASVKKSKSKKSRYHELERELEVINGLIVKAKKLDLVD